MRFLFPILGFVIACIHGQNVEDVHNSVNCQNDVCLNSPSAELIVNRVGNSFAAEVINFDIEHAADADAAIIHSLLLEHKVLVFRNQSQLTVEGMREFTMKFGTLHVHLEATSHHPDYADVNVVSNIKNSTGMPTGLYGDHVENFHSDLSWAHLPTKITLLHSVIRPSTGGGAMD